MTAPRVSLVVRDGGTMGGIARYVHELASGLAGSDRVQLQLAGIDAGAGAWPVQLAVEVERFRMPLGGSLAVFKLPLRETDVVHFPLHESFPAYAMLRTPVVMTIHSVEPLFLSAEEVLGGPAPRLWRLPYNLLRAFRRGIDLVITPSETTATEIERYLRIPRERIRVIPHGVSQVFLEPHEPYVLPNGHQFVLHVSHHQPQKNVARLIEAFAQVDEGVDLVIGGDTSRCEAAYAEAVARHDLGGRVHFIGPVADDAALASLYRGALAFAMPSFHESFGLPALEAAAAGCAVIVGRGTGAAETAAGAGIPVDPRSTEELAQALLDVTRDAELRVRLGALGRSRASELTWARSIAAHEQAYREVAA